MFNYTHININECMRWSRPFLSSTLMMTQLCIQEEVGGSMKLPGQKATLPVKTFKRV
jgi:hypothetical protein